MGFTYEVTSLENSLLPPIFFHVPWNSGVNPCVYHCIYIYIFYNIMCQNKFRNSFINLFLHRQLTITDHCNAPVKPCVRPNLKKNPPTKNMPIVFHSNYPPVN